MISGLGWVSELVTAAGGIEVFPHLGHRAKTPRTESSRRKP